MRTAMLAIIFSVTAAAVSIPRTAQGRPNLSGVWQAESTANAGLENHVAGNNMLAGRSVVLGGEIPYQPWAKQKRAENFASRVKADPYRKCFLPGTPRIMYLDYPFQIFQTEPAIAMTFEWSLAYRLIHTNGTKHPTDYDSWMGDSRGHWEGDTLVVDVANQNGQTWLDMSGNFHSDAIHVVERYRMIDENSIQYEATIDDPKVFTKPWTIRIVLRRRMDRDRLFEYVCQAEYEEEAGLFDRELRTWYPGDGTTPPTLAASAWAPTQLPVVRNLKRLSSGKPDFNGFYLPDAGGANYGLEKRVGGNPLTPPGRGVIIDPPDGILPMRPWAVEERVSRNLPERGYDDPTAHCFPPGVPRSMYVPTSLHMIQTSESLVILHERTAWRIIALNRSQHLPDNMRLWQGDSIGHWEGDTLVVETTNLNGKTWLNEGGEIVSYAERVVERFTPSDQNTIAYRATVEDPVVYSRPWTIAVTFDRDYKFELMEGACHEEDHSLPHLKEIRDAARRN